jgi:tetratricopeptide (TPR) repeat protein
MLPESAVAGNALSRGDSPSFRTVQGRPLVDAIAGYRQSPSTLGLHDVLRPFLAACQELTYAHGHDIVHLGLTPRVILVGECGETVVVGWERLMAAAGNGEPPAADAYAAGFLAPEQVLGPPERVGPASDVYALGAVLYAILTGQPPHTGPTPAEVLNRVRAGLPWQPRMVAARVPVALEAVCLTAMEREPADRYATPAELAREIERWMAGERVRTNYVEPKTARLTRWARGKPGFWALIILLVLAILALAALAIAIWVIRTERAQLDPALHENERLRQHLDQATAGLRQSKQYVDAVNQQRAVASEELGTAAQALQVLALKAQHRPDDPAAAYKTDLQRTILSAALQLAQRADQSGGSDVGAARDRTQIGSLFLALGQTAEARRHYERAVAITRSLAQVRPEDAAVQGQFVHAARNLGQLCLAEGQTAFAAKLAREAQTAAEAWAKIEPNNLVPRREAVSSLGLLADTCCARYDWPAAREALEAMSAAVDRYAASDPNNVLVRFDQAECNIGRGRVERLDFRFKDALPWYDRAIAILQPLEAEGKLKAYPQVAARLNEVKQRADECRQVLKAVDDIQVALNEPPDRAMHLLVGRACALVRMGRPAEAADTAERLRRLKPEDGANLYNVACCYGLCVTAAEEAEKIRYLRQGIADLRAAANHGFRDIAKIESDPDLAALRQDPGYRGLVAQLKALRAWLTCPTLP